MKILPTDGLLRKTRVVTDESTLPNRLVLRQAGGASFITHVETLKVVPDPDFPGEHCLAHHSYLYGHYFIDRARADQDFEERAKAW